MGEHPGQAVNQKNDSYQREHPGNQNSLIRMATHVAHIQPESITIRPEDHELLRAALADWYDKTAFTDEHVMQVAFQRWLVETAWAKQHDPIACVLCLHSDGCRPA